MVITVISTTFFDFGGKFLMPKLVGEVNNEYLLITCLISAEIQDLLPNIAGAQSVHMEPII